MKEQLLEIIEECVQKKVTLDDGLLSTGLLDSIVAVDLILSIQSELGVEIPITEAVEILSTVQTVVDYVENNQ